MENNIKLRIGKMVRKKEVPCIEMFKRMKLRLLILDRG